MSEEKLTSIENRVASLERYLVQARPVPSDRTQEAIDESKKQFEQLRSSLLRVDRPVSTVSIDRWDGKKVSGIRVGGKLATRKFAVADLPPDVDEPRRGPVEITAGGEAIIVEGGTEVLERIRRLQILETKDEGPCLGVGGPFEVEPDTNGGVA